jgi:diaminopimelate epimerase
MSDESRQLGFCKMEGAGNDFILINGALHSDIPDLGRLAHRICARRTSVGADGLIVVGPSQRSDATVRVRFWNPDGQETATCGNGTRCAARFAVLEGLSPDRMLIETLGGDIEASVAGETVTLGFRTVPSLALDITVTGPDGPQIGHRAEIGIPHLVIPVDVLPDGPIEPLCRPLRHASELGPEGANVNLAQIVDRHRIRLRTYERGVEAETLACGSGSLGTAMALSAAGLVDSPVAVETHSGDLLTVRFERDSDGNFARPELEGPARVVYWAHLGDLGPTA